MTHRLVQELAADGVPVAVTCRVLKVSRSAYYDWAGAGPSQRDWNDAHLTNTITAIHVISRRSYGAPRVHAELRLGLGMALGRKRVARLMRQAGIMGISHRRKHGGRQHRLPAVHDDLVQRRFVAEAPDQLWATDITEHPTTSGKVYCARSSTPAPGSSSGGPSPTTCAPNSSSTPSRWHCGDATPSQDQSCTPTEDLRVVSPGRRNTSSVEVCGGS